MDQLEAPERASIQGWGRDFDTLYDALVSESPTMTREVNIEFLKGLMELKATNEIIPISSYEGEGFSDLYNGVQQSFAGGEDLEER